MKKLGEHFVTLLVLILISFVGIKAQYCNEQKSVTKTIKVPESTWEYEARSPFCKKIRKTYKFCWKKVQKTTWVDKEITELETVTACCNGYTKIQETCTPLCDPLCENGHCEMPNVCKCDQGYEHRQGDDDFYCSPVCMLGCINGQCTKPNKCECAANHYLVEVNHLVGSLLGGGGECLPQCDPTCGMNGKCVDVNQCECKTGFKAVASLGIDGEMCVPQCDPPCLNGKCTNVNQCECLEGFEKVATNECQPICTEGCVNSVCQAPDKCSCWEGYLPVNASYCVPHCDHECLKNGFCSSPNQCSCVENYILNNETNTCDPVCDPECRNGKCFEPYKCQCDDGYRLDPKDQFSCVPHCHFDCINGTCLSPNLCQCESGHKSETVYVESIKTGEICVPQCDPKCKNGDCVGVNQCQCYDGFAKDRGLECKPVCNKKCINSDCVAPEKCQCWEGYYSTNQSSCEPKCDPACLINGKCLNSMECICKGSFYGIFHKAYCYEVLCKFGRVQGDVCVCPDNFTFDGHSSCVQIQDYPSSESTLIASDFSSAYSEILMDTTETEETVDYELESVELSTPISNCLQGCINGFCEEATGNCTCFDGFKLAIEDESLCVELSECEKCRRSGSTSCACMEIVEYPLILWCIVATCIFITVLTMIGCVIYCMRKHSDNYSPNDTLVAFAINNYEA